MNLQEKFVITIARELGSGGHTVGKILAERLGVKCYDKAVVDGLVKHFNLTSAQIEEIKGAKTHWWDDFASSALVVGATPTYEEFATNPVTAETHYPTSGELFFCEKEILQGIAERESCVITGRSGFFILKNHPNMLAIYIGASMPTRIKRVMEKQKLSEKEAKEVIEMVDKRREDSPVGKRSSTTELLRRRRNGNG